jgi:UV DNA damage endonuclease
MARNRLAVENDDSRYGVEHVLEIHRSTGAPVVFDVHHHNCFNPSGVPLKDAVERCMQTWRDLKTRPKVHFSSPRTDWGYRYDSKREKSSPRWAAHAEFADPFAFIDLYRSIQAPKPDVMLEAKAKDVAVLQLRSDLERYAPDLASLFISASRETEVRP